MNFLYLADVHFRSQKGRLATGYRWQFHRHGPCAAEVQDDIDECVKSGLLRCEIGQRADEAGEVPLYRGYGMLPDLRKRFSATLEEFLGSEVERWVGADLNAFLDYVRFEAASMGELDLDEEIGPRGGESPLGAIREFLRPPPKKQVPQEARRAFQRFLADRRARGTKVPVPHDAIVDDAFAEAVAFLDADDTLAGPLRGSVEVDPDALT